MGIANLTGPRAKLGWANKHLDTFQKGMADFAANHTNAGRITARSEGEWGVIEIEPIPPLPTELVLIGGDFFNSLRTALDYLVWQLVLREDKEPGRQHSFPICITREDFINKVESLAKKGKKSCPLYGIPLHGDAWALIERSQPYQRGDAKIHSLTTLSRFVRTDKHHTLLSLRVVVDVQKILDGFFRHTREQPVERIIPENYLFGEEHAEIARFRFPPSTNIQVQMERDVSCYPYIGDGEAYVSLGALMRIVSEVQQILDQVATLPRVQG